MEKHPRHVKGLFDTVGEPYNKARCYNPDCLRTFCYVDVQHLFCTEECFKDFQSKHPVDWSNPEEVKTVIHV